MRLKTKLVLAITALVFLIAGVVSLVYVHQLVKAAVLETYDTNQMVADQVRYALQNALEAGLKDRMVAPNDPGALRALVAETVQNDPTLQAALVSVIRYSSTVYDVDIGDSQGLVLLSTNPDNEGKPLPARPDYDELRKAGPVRMMMLVFGQPKVLDIIAPLKNNGKLFASVHVGVHTSLLRAVYEPLLRKAFWLMGFALIAALLAAFSLSNLALRPMTEISRQLDRLTAAGGAPIEEQTPKKQDVAAQVSTKIEKIGQRMRNVEEIYSALRENLDQILGNLQDGIMLFTEDRRAVLVSEAARRFLQIDRDNILGLQAREILDDSNELGRTLREAIESGRNLEKEEIRTEGGRRIQASVNFINDDETQKGLGALVTLHDLESAAEIESELELSRRMAAIGRLTSGVGHEVKNPINAIVVHLELLKSKLGESNGPAARHLEVIDAEIRRLDRVVQTLVDFARPVEVKLREQDLRPVIGDVLALAADELTMRRVTLISHIPAEPLIANVDADLLKQAALNVIQNGAQAMPDGGRLEVTLEEDRDHGENQARAGKPNGTAGGGGHPATYSAVLRVADEGIGIPDEIRDKIFDLYFTTKIGGSGIGLAMTYRILQLHHGSVEVQSRQGRGTEFRLRIPLAAAERGRRNLQPAAVEDEKGMGGMKSPAKCAAWLLPLLLAGCFHMPFHKGQPAEPMLAPLIEPSVPLELAFVELPPTMRLIPGKPLYNMRVHDESVKPLIRHWRAANPPEIVNTPEAPTNPSPEVSAIGELSSGDPSSYRQQTEQSIASIERGLNGINRTLSDSDQKTADQIREFLKEARTALASGDVDGARTLVAKAQVLLAALTQ